ncbi:MAG: hypothetical protein AB7F19_07495 [Candidatus Babeliales bacterium]
MNTKDRIKSYLGSGLKPAQICSIIGCTPSYVSQLLKDEEFKAEVEALRDAGAVPEDERLDKKYVSVEHRLVERIHEEAEHADIGQLARALDSVVKAQDMKHTRKNPVAAAGAMVNVNLVSLTLPAHAIPTAQPSVVLNEKHEVVAIDNKPMAPMSSDGVKNLFATLAAKKKEHDVLAAIATGAASTELPAIPSDF